MLEEAITITQNQDATAHQVGYMQPEVKGNEVQMEVHKLPIRPPSAKKGKPQPQKNC